MSNTLQISFSGRIKSGHYISLYALSESFVTHYIALQVDESGYGGVEDLSFFHGSAFSCSATALESGLSFLLKNCHDATISVVDLDQIGWGNEVSVYQIENNELNELDL
jgi:hypothetical protein